MRRLIFNLEIPKDGYYSQTKPRRISSYGSGHLSWAEGEVCATAQSYGLTMPVRRELA